MKAKLRRFFVAAAFILLELVAVIAYLPINAAIERYVPPQLQFAIPIAVGLSFIVGPLVLYGIGRALVGPWRRRRDLRRSLAAISADGVVVVMGRSGTSRFSADAIIRLAVPDAIAAIDKTPRLLRIKAIGPPQDCTIDLAHVIGLAWQPGENRDALKAQSPLRRNAPSYRTLPELPCVRLEIATKGREPVLEYLLHSDRGDGRALERFHALLERTTRSPRYRQLAATRPVLDQLPIQGSRHSHELA